MVIRNIAQFDVNNVITLIGVSSIDLATPVTIAVNPATYAIIVEIA